MLTKRSVTVTVQVFEGVPPPYDKMKRMVVPDALRVLRLHPRRKYTVIGRLATEYGWKYGEVVSTLEEKRKEKARAYYEAKKKSLALRRQAQAAKVSELTQVNATLEVFGY